MWRRRELVRNLLHNAVKNTPDESRLEVTLRRDARHGVLTIADNGPGISNEQCERLFQPFAAGPAGPVGAQTGGLVGESPRGSGLGLAICQEIVLSLGGSIALDHRASGDSNAPVAGLDAIVRLPVADNRPA